LRRRDLVVGALAVRSHIAGPTSLLTTMYGRVLGVKILIFGTMLLLGMVNQFWLHPRIDAHRAGGDERALLTILMRRFPAIVAVEVLAISVTAVLPKIPAKEVTSSTWVWGASETVAVAGVMIIGFAVSGRIAHRRGLAVAAPP